MWLSGESLWTARTCQFPPGVAVCGMTLSVTLDIPDDLLRELSAKFDNIGRAAFEALAARAYTEDALSLEQVRLLLKLPSSWEAMNVLKRHGAWPGMTVQDALADMQMLEELRAGAS